MSGHFNTRELFHLPNNITYLDGNSLGPLPKKALQGVEKRMREEWGEMLITAWNKAGWMGEPVTLANRLGRLIGARTDTTVLGDTLSIKVFQAVSAGLHLNKGRKKILSDTGNFPTDLYMADGLAKLSGQGQHLVTVEPQEVENALDEDVAVLMLTHVDYRTGRMHDMADLTEKAHEKGIITVWDLAHSAGAVEVDLSGCNADFAVGCTYKFLNAGPGAPAFIYVRPDLVSKIEPALCGWLGHAAPFEFEPQYRPGLDIERMRVGTPSVLQMASLSAALDAFDGIEMKDVRARAIELGGLFIDLVERDNPDLKLASPRDTHKRGSQVSFHFEHGYGAIQALIERGVIGDFRAPDIMRFGITPLYLDEVDIEHAASQITAVMSTQEWADARWQHRARVT